MSITNYILLFSQEKHILNKLITAVWHSHWRNIMKTCVCLWGGVTFKVHTIIYIN